jgi:tetratricopeptide (TPR) repeat protein
MRIIDRYQLKIYAVMLIALVNILPAYSANTYSNPYLDLGIFAFEESDHASAISHLKRAVLQQPNNALVYHYLAKTYQDMKRYKEARLYYDQACRIDPNLDDLLYDRGYFNFITEKYHDALDDFFQVVKQQPDNLMANYYAGICAFKTNEYQVALKYFLTSATQNSNVKEHCEYYAAVCYFQTGKPDQARNLFNKLTTHSQSETLKSNAKKWLDIFKNNPSIFRPYHLYVNLTMTYDDNIKLVPSDETVSDKDDLLIKTYLGGNYNIVQSPIFIIGLGYDHFQTNHVDFSDYNIVGSKGSLFLSYHNNNTEYSLSLSPQYLWLNNKAYMSLQGLSYDIKWQRNKYFKMLANFEYAVYNNVDNNDYDGQDINFDIGMERTFTENEKLSFISGFSILNKNTKGKDKKYQAGKFGCGLKYKNDQLKWFFGGNYSVKNYLYQDSTFLKRRNDKRVELFTMISLSGFTIEPECQIEHQINSSNIDQYDYKKTSISFSLRYFY